MNFLADFPNLRMRRLRNSPNIRSLVEENHLKLSDLIYPMFIVEGINQKQEIHSMPNIHRFSLDELLKEAEIIYKLGIPYIALFPFIEQNKKSLQALEAFNENGLIQKAIKALKKSLPDLGIITDVALDPFTIHGQDGVLNSKGEIDNDLTNEILIKQALSQADAGADIIAPSDMMDGRIGLIRQALEKNNFSQVQILAYSGKFASNFYNPFRDAVGSATNLQKANKFTYQINPANSNEALRDVALDVKEGADLIMIKPAGAYLDVIYRVKQTFLMPTLAYQVSGEYAMQMAAINNGWLNENIIFESLIGIKRAGADAILTYAAKYIAQNLNKF